LYLLSDFIVILSFRSVCQLCGWTVPTSGPRYLICFSDALRHQSEVLCVLWTVVTLSGPKYCTCCWINVSPSGPKYYFALGCLSNCPFRRILSFALSFALSPFICPFFCPFVCPFPFLSFPIPSPKTSANFLGDTSCNRSSWAFTLVLSPQPY
jgi:hypothetical protein